MRNKNDFKKFLWNGLDTFEVRNPGTIYVGSFEVRVELNGPV